MVDDDGEIAAIIDWEECLSTIAPQFELSISLHDLSIDEKHVSSTAMDWTAKRWCRWRG